MVPGFVAGQYRAAELTLDVRPLARRAGARVVVSAATGVAAAAGRIEAVRREAHAARQHGDFFDGRRAHLEGEIRRFIQACHAHQRRVARRLGAEGFGRVEHRECAERAGAQMGIAE